MYFEARLLALGTLIPVSEFFLSSFFALVRHDEGEGIEFEKFELLASKTWILLCPSLVCRIACGPTASGLMSDMHKWHIEDSEASVKMNFQNNQSFYGELSQLCHGRLTTMVCPPVACAHMGMLPP